jgi:hypothetical protein
MDVSKIPLYWGVVFTIILYLGIGLWAVLRPKEYIYKDAPNKAKWRDLRIWAVALVVIQILIYITWGGK